MAEDRKPLPSGRGSSQYLKKGKPVFVEGRLRTRKWQDKDGQERYTTEIVVESMQLLGWRGDEDGSAPEPQAERAGSKGAANAATAPKTASAGVAAMADDIPF